MLTLSAAVADLIADAEPRRRLAEYDTGSITADEACALWALADLYHARVVLEVGTFIGTSTTALAAAESVEAVYTCDVSNDCLSPTAVIHVYPKYTSTQMLQDMVQRGVLADLCFFDGSLRPQDAALIQRVTHPRTVYAFHDYNYGPKIRRRKGRTYLEEMPRKGIGNVALVRPQMPTHRLVAPTPGTTLALLLPEGRL